MSEKIWNRIRDIEREFLVEKHNELTMLKQGIEQSPDLQPVCQMYELAYKKAYESFQIFSSEIDDLNRYFHGMPTERPIAGSLSQVPVNHRRPAAVIMGMVRCLGGRPSDIHRSVIRKKQAELINALGNNILSNDPTGLEEDVQSYGNYIFAPECVMQDTTNHANTQRNLLFGGGGLLAGFMAGLYKEPLMGAFSRLMGGSKDE